MLVRARIKPRARIPTAGGKDYMATQGSTYRQELPEGVKRHREHIKMQAESAKAQRRKKGRGNGKRYCYNGVRTTPRGEERTNVQ